MNNEEKFLEFRGKFPAYNQGVYMNHAAVSPLSEDVKNTFLNYWDKRAHMPVDIYPGFQGVKKELKSMLCRLINGDSTEEFALVPNTSTGLNMIASGLKWKAGDRVILNTMEFPANIYPFLKLKKQGVEIDWVNPVEGKVIPGDIEKLATERTRMVAISFVQFINGFKADLETIGNFCRDRNIWFVVDGIQGTGAVPIDVQKCKIDAFVNGGHKWLMWPMGLGFLYASRRMLAHMEPAFAGWLSVKESWNLFEYELDFLDNAEKFETGTLNFVGMYAAHSTLSRLMDLGVEDIHQRVLMLTDRLLEGFKALDLDVVTPEDKESRSGIVSIKAPNPEELFKKMMDANIVGAVREGITRFAPHCGNTMEDVEVVLDFMKKQA
ncbi:MAG: aminotransferase class V-fold PLP-dependent enzyme [bacterium]|nr:aminotransferase class V-fold PLP-dependent enzyme [bacterium]